MGIRISNKEMIGALFASQPIKKILYASSTVWEAQEGNCVIFDGGTRLVKGTEHRGYFDFTYAYGNYLSDAIYYSGNEAAHGAVAEIKNNAINVKCFFDNLGSSSEIYLGCYGVEIDMTKYSTLHFVVSDYSFESVGPYTTLPKIQIESDPEKSYSVGELPYGFPYIALVDQKKEFVIDISRYVGKNTIRLFGVMTVTRMWLE